MKIVMLWKNLQEPYVRNFYIFENSCQCMKSFTGFPTKLTNIIIKIQSLFVWMPKRLTLDSLVTLISDIWMLIGTLELAIR